MPFLEYFSICGQHEAYHKPLRDRLFLLDDTGEILLVRSDNAADHALVGKSFFRTFHVLREEQEALFEALHAFGGGSQLFLAGKIPAVAWCSFFKRTLLYIVALPEGDIARCLAHPAAYTDPFCESFILFSKQSLAEYEPIKEELYHPTAAYLRDLKNALYYATGFTNQMLDARSLSLLPSDIFIDTLQHRISALAELIGVDIDYNYNGAGYAQILNFDGEATCANVALIFLLARRASEDGRVVLSLSREGVEGPVLEAFMTLKDADDELKELQILARVAERNGELFALARHQQEPNRILIKCSVCRKELSRQPGCKAWD